VSCPRIVRAAQRPLAVTLTAVALSCAPRAASDGARSLQVLVTEVPRGLDPYEDQRLTSVQIYANVYEPLVRLGSGASVVPALAESWHSPSSDETIFHLRPGVRFHDGTPVDARVVVESLERARHSSHVSGHFADVTEVRALDARSVLLRTRAPVAVLVFGLTGVFITRPGGPGLVGTGPYRVDSFVPGESVRLVRFEDYAGPSPYLDEAIFRRYEGDQHALRLLRERPRTLLAPASPVVAAQARQHPQVRAVARPTRILHYLAFGLDAPGAAPFRDVRVRRAVRAALDATRLVRDASPGGGEAASQLVPPGTIGFDPAQRVPARDLAAARELLAASGHPDGLDLTLDVRAKNADLARAVAAQLAGAGIRVQLRVLAVDEFAHRIEGQSPFFLYNWIVGQEAGSALRNFLHTRDPSRSLGLQNRTGYSSAEVDQLLERAGGPVSPAERVSLQQRAMALLMQDLPWIPLFIPNEHALQPADLEIPTRVDEMLILADMKPSPRT
jgi:peptide/nickel transport system substrate-binding protein